MVISNTAIIAGVDIGGTYARVALLTPQGKKLAMRSSPLQPERGPDAGLDLIANLIRDALHDSGSGRLAGIGVGASGPVDSVRGLIQNPYTLPTWENVPIVAELERVFQTPVVLENDADSAALGEYWLGSGRNVRRLYAITVGTGIGTAFLLDGKVYRGLDGAHPEAGHHLVDPDGPLCYCGVRGCWESLASGTAIAAFARQQALGTDNRILTLANGQLEAITAELVAQAAHEGDPLASQIMSKAASDFTRGLLNVIAFFIPDMVVLSGGVMRSQGLFLPAIHEGITHYSVMSPANRVKIAPAALGYEAGVIGAAFAALKRLE